MSPKIALKILGIIVLCIAIFFAFLYFKKQSDLMPTENEGLLKLNEQGNSNKNKVEENDEKVKKEETTQEKIKEDMIKKIEEFNKAKVESNNSDNNTDNSAESKTEEEIRQEMLKKIEEFNKAK